MDNHQPAIKQSSRCSAYLLKSSDGDPGAFEFENAVACSNGSDDVVECDRRGTGALVIVRKTKYFEEPGCQIKFVRDSGTHSVSDPNERRALIFKNSDARVGPVQDERVDRFAQVETIPSYGDGDVSADEGYGLDGQHA